MTIEQYLDSMFQAIKDSTLDTIDYINALNELTRLRYLALGY